MNFVNQSDASTYIHLPEAVLAETEGAAVKRSLRLIFEGLASQLSPLVPEILGPTFHDWKDNTLVNPGKMKSSVSTSQSAATTVIAGFTEAGKNLEDACYGAEWGKAQDDAKAWSDVVSKWLTDNLGKDYATRFNSSSAPGPPDARYNPVQQQCWIFVSSRVAALNRIDSELHRK
jgi:hypothetical protein